MDARIRVMIVIALVGALVAVNNRIRDRPSDAHPLYLTRYSAAPSAPVALGRMPQCPGPPDAYAYCNRPSISRRGYIDAWCDPNGDGDGRDRSPACPEAGAMYDILVAAGIDPAIQYAQAYHETSLGRAGVGRPDIKNLHGVQCHAGDGRIADSPVPWGNGCAGVYQTYRESVRTWARLIWREYIAVGLRTPGDVIPKYAPSGKDGNNPPAYIASMRHIVDQIRARDRR